MANIFISSTFEDLTEFRGSVQKALRKLGVLDISMENFGSREQRPLDECLKLISEEADIFVGIYAHRYGFIPENEGMSITELEYHHAIKCSIPALIFIVHEDCPWHKKFIDFGENESKLIKFKNHLQSAHVCSYFENKDHLATIVVTAIGRHLSYKNIEDIDKAEQRDVSNSEDWSRYRDEIYQLNRGIFLTHVLTPSNIPNQKYTIFIYLLKHKSDNIGIDEVDFVDFFFGSAWNNRIYRIYNRGAYIGISLSAFGEFLCTCKIVFKDGNHIFTHRYIDFESGENAKEFISRFV